MELPKAGPVRVSDGGGQFGLHSTTRMPRPPPPPAALMITGYPIRLAMAGRLHAGRPSSLVRWGTGLLHRSRWRRPCRPSGEWSRRGTDEDEAGAFHHFGEVGIPGEEAAARVNASGAGDFGGGERSPGCSGLVRRSRADA